MTITELEAYRYLKVEIKDLEEKLEDLQAQIIRITQKISETSGAGSSVKYQSQQEKYVAESEFLSKELEEKKKRVRAIEEFISNVRDLRMQLIIKFRFVDGLQWSAVAAKLGGNNTEDSVSKAFERFFKKQENN